MTKYLSPPALRVAVDFLNLVSQGPYGVDEGWIKRTGSAVAAQESSGRLDPDIAARFAFASSQSRISDFVGLVNDPDFVEPGGLALRVEPSILGLAKFDSEFFGLNAALVNPEHGVALLATVDDFSILVGPRSFVADFEPNPVAALNDFREFVHLQDRVLRPVAARALTLFERYGTM